MAENTKIRVWLSHDGYRDPDDNLAMLIGGAQADAVAAASGRVAVGGFVYGDTKDGGQFYMLDPTGRAPEAFGSDPRYGDEAGNKVAAGNYEFYKDYGRAAIRDLGGWAQYDLLAEDPDGTRAWNFDAQTESGITAAAAALADDIRAAIADGNEVVVYSAGGGANVPAEAIGYLYNQGLERADIAEHFAIVQHGRGNWVKQYEDEARELTVSFTIALSNQNVDRYGNGMSGPDLKHAVKPGTELDGSAFGDDFDRALDVALGVKDYQGLRDGVTFRTTRDASDAGSHAFAVDVDELLGAMGSRMRPGEWLPDDDGWGYRIQGRDGDRLRVIYDEFDAGKIAELLDGDRNPASAPAAEPPDSGGGPAGGAPFATGGPAARLGGAALYGFGADGAAAEVVSAGGRVGVASAGDPDTIDHAGAGSERLGLDFGADLEALTLRLANLSARPGAREAAELTAYDAAGDALDSWVFTRTGQTRVEFGEGVRYATLEAADAGGAAEPDFALVSIGLHYDL